VLPLKCVIRHQKPEKGKQCVKKNKKPSAYVLTAKAAAFMTAGKMAIK